MQRITINKPFQFIAKDGMTAEDVKFFLYEVNKILFEKFRDEQPEIFFNRLEEKDIKFEEVVEDEDADDV